jgi:hypothetical protein
MGRFIPIIVVSLPFLLAGCRTNPRNDLIEAELRTKDRQLRELQGRCQTLEMMNHSLEGELLQRSGMAQLPPNTTSAVLGPKDMILASGTGGVREHQELGDDALQVVVLPRDEDGNPVRALGELVVYAFEIQQGGTKTPLCGWEVSISDLRRTWKNGLISKGYHVVLPWKKLPTQEKLRVVAQLRLPDGRVLEAEKDISIRPPKTGTIVPAQPVPAAPVPRVEEISPEPIGPTLSKRAAELLPPRPHTED